MEMKTLSRFTPSLLPGQTLETIFVQREEMAGRLVELIHDSILTDAKHHTILVGPRGIGKTHLISLIYHRVRKANDLQDRLRIAWLREEEWGIATFLDLLVRILRALRDESRDQSLEEQIEGLYKLPPDIAEHQAAELLKSYCDKRTLLLFIENMDVLFEGLEALGQQRFRAFIQENPFLTILGSAQRLFNGVSRQTSPFYGFFRVQYLEELSFEEAVLLLKKIALFKGDQELASFLDTSAGRSRVRAAYHLTGGNHRVFIIFSEFLTRKSLDELVDALMRTLDELTPYYQSRIAWLSPQQRKIVELLCERRGAVTVKEIAERCFITHQTASSQLKDLREKGYVQSRTFGRESYYELQEPLMRISIEVKMHNPEPIRLVVDFIRFWYSQKELRQWLEGLRPEAMMERKYISNALELFKIDTDDPRLRSCVNELIDYCKNGQDERARQVLEELTSIEESMGYWIDTNLARLVIERGKEAVMALQKALELNSPHGFVADACFMAAAVLKEWDEAFHVLSITVDKGLASKYGTGHLSFLLESWAKGTPDFWHTHIPIIIDLYQRHGRIHELAVSLGVSSIPAAGEFSEARAKEWLAVWREHGKDHQPLVFTLSLLDVAAQYRGKLDERILLDLPVEQREVVKILSRVKEEPLQLGAVKDDEDGNHH